MKRTILLVAFLLTAYSANSQVLISLVFGDALNSPNVEFGLDGGVNFGNIANLESGKSLAMFNLGFYFDIRLKGPLLLAYGSDSQVKPGS